MTESPSYKAQIALSPSKRAKEFFRNQHRHYFSSHKIQSAMFQRQSRKSFPATYIVILAAAILGILFFMLKGLNKAEPQPAEPPMEQTENQ